jgi:hypothetical protein
MNTDQVKGRIPTLFGARTFLGDEVYNQREDRLGTLKEFMLDLDSGRICYAVMSSGGFLGVGEKLFAIPWRALTHDAENECFVLDIAEARLMNSPGFDKRHWPDMTDAAWVQDINTFYGIKPETCVETDMAVQAGRSSLVRATHTKGTPT